METKRKSQKATADAEFTTTQTKLNMGINLENIQATRRAEVKDAELQREVEVKRAEMELERMRAYVFSEASVAFSIQESWVLRHVFDAGITKSRILTPKRTC